MNASVLFKAGSSAVVKLRIMFEKGL